MSPRFNLHCKGKSTPWRRPEDTDSQGKENRKPEKKPQDWKKVQKEMVLGKINEKVDHKKIASLKKEPLKDECRRMRACKMNEVHQ